MGVTYRIDDDRGVLYESWSGDLCEEEIVNFYVQLNESSELKPGLSILIDVRAVETAELSLEGIRSIVSSFETRQETCGMGRIAMVATQDLLYAYGRMMLALIDGMSQPPETRVVRDLETALAWLDEIPN
ncbi:MAG: STAS/SEC14 domain-containing protein [Alphaproteobacteria bacterium]|jgi:hypothetical protein|nr:STAS/SEC14 domain-containing protein [Alphaproteobacteria bacterium]